MYAMFRKVNGKSFRGQSTHALVHGARALSGAAKLDPFRATDARSCRSPLPFCVCCFFISRTIVPVSPTLGAHSTVQPTPNRTSLCVYLQLSPSSHSALRSQGEAGGMVPHRAQARQERPPDQRPHEQIHTEPLPLYHRYAWALPHQLMRVLAQGGVVLVVAHAADSGSVSSRALLVRWRM